MNKKQLIAIVGPTAVGKTKVAIELAQYYQTEIVSFDSRQFYKEMNIGTAVPTKEELETIPHHFIQNRSIHQPYTVGEYEKEANRCINNLFKNKEKVILVGGSGLYEKAITKGLDDFPTIDDKIKNELELNFEKQGIEYLQNLLAQKDPQYFAKVDKQNHRRLIRALEVCLSTHKSYSSFLEKKTESKKQFNTIKIGLELPREELYQRINERVDKMMEQGLLQEVENLYPFKQLKPLQTVGYTELFDFIDNKTNFQQAVEEIKKNTRRYAKRQMTWYRKELQVNWFEPKEVEKIKIHIN